jgi:hypothetical protein
MELEEFFDYMNRMKDVYENSIKGTCIQLEIDMWRRRFLDSIPKTGDKKVDDSIRGGFFYVPCETMVKEGPEKIFNQALECMKKGN